MSLSVLFSLTHFLFHIGNYVLCGEVVMKCLRLWDSI